ncbi:carboxylesterase 1-like [Abrus precatorius]|uniref:Carboxylesterase 1-like n=1 Tax=Abrus precatorius TaxID=3816 RepID=A0A8B8MGW3_ABRPR|nr:carboxylesterase 1-like [Abrus precatorius]
MSNQVNPFHHLKIVRNSNGTITRLRRDPHTPPTPDPTLPIPVLTNDAPINQSNNTFARIFLPSKALHHSPKKLPLIVYFHGGGFVLFSAASDFLQDACINLANDVNSIVVSVEYRLAPEHRLPAAYHDAVEALHWIKAQSNDWLRNHADYSNCYLMGSSAGANIAYHAALRVAAEVDRDYLGPLKIRGLILTQPFFGGTKRVPSELKLENDPVLPPHVCDLLWELSLPVGVDRDHEYCNPTAGDGPAILDRVRQLGWRVLVTGCHGDPLVHHQVALAKLIKEKGVAVVSHFSEGGCHGIEVRDRTHQKQLYNLVNDFIASSSSLLGLDDSGLT